MEYFDFEGRTEAEAIERAAAELKLDPEQFEVELLTTASRGLFRASKVKIRAYPLESSPASPPATQSQINPELEQDVLKLLDNFFAGLAGIIGVDCKPQLQRVRNNLLEVELVSEQCGYLIGHHGKHLEALQTLVTAFLSNHYQGQNIFVRVILDAEGYRSRREKQLRRLAKNTAQKVIRNQGSELLEPMGAFERRIIHTSLSDMRDVSTVSEGEGERRKVRILYRG